MFNISIALFLIAALFGIYMASRIFRGALPPWGAVTAHGALAASGLVLLLYTLFTGTQAAALTIGAVLLVVAALGGFFMLTFQLRNAPPPKAIVVVHALAAVAGVACLLSQALSVA